MELKYKVHPLVALALILIGALLLIAVSNRAERNSRRITRQSKPKATPAPAPAAAAAAAAAAPAESPISSGTFSAQRVKDRMNQELFTVAQDAAARTFQRQQRQQGQGQDSAQFDGEAAFTMDVAPGMVIEMEAIRD